MSIDEYNLIEKSKALVWAKFTGYSKMELKILEVYLSKINARDADSSRVEFTLSEFGEAVGVQQLRANQVKKYTDVLQRTTIQVKSDKSRYGFTSMVVFPTAKCEQEIDGQYHITLRCNDDLKPVFFNLASSGYTRYRLGATIGMKSKYSILLYSILLDNLHRGKWQMSVQALREQLGVPDEKYKEPKDFCKYIVEKAVKEINGNSNCDITVECGRVLQGRKTAAVWFEAYRKSEPAEDVQQESAPPDPEGPEEPEERTIDDALVEMFHDLIEPKIGESFTDTQIKVLIRFASQHVDCSDDDLTLLNITDYWIAKLDLMQMSDNVAKPKAWFTKAVQKNYT